MNNIRYVSLGLCTLLATSSLLSMQKTRVKEHARYSTTVARWFLAEAVLATLGVGPNQNPAGQHGGYRIPNPPFVATNPQQQEFIDMYINLNDQLIYFAMGEMGGFAYNDSTFMNRKLAERGFTAFLRDRFVPSSNKFGIAAESDVQVNWSHNGIKTSLKGADGNNYPAIRLTENVNLYKIGKRKIISVQAEPKEITYFTAEKPVTVTLAETVWLTPADEPLEGHALEARIKEIKTALTAKVRKTRKTEVVLPMVDLVEETNVPWLAGLKIAGYPHEIAEAKQLTRFKMGGYRGQQICGTETPHTVVIDRPFYIWIERENVSHPIFAGYITEKNWAEPKELDAKKVNKSDSDSSSSDESSSSASSSDSSNSSESSSSVSSSSESSNSSESSDSKADDRKAKAKKKAQKAEAKKIAKAKKRAHKQAAEERKAKNKAELHAKREKIKTEFKASKKASKQAKTAKKFNAYIAKYEAQKAKELAKREKEYKKALAELEEKHAKENAERDSYYAKWQEAFDAKKHELN